MRHPMAAKSVEPFALRPRFPASQRYSGQATHRASCSSVTNGDVRAMCEAILLRLDDYIDRELSAEEALLRAPSRRVR
jgi:hypothetical protein